MSVAAPVLPVCPGEADDVFSLRDRLRLRDNYGFVLQRLRARGAFSTLAKGPWSVFIAIAAHFQMNAEAWPGQDTIAQFSGCSIRSVRYHVAVLEREGFLVLRRERRSDGGERIFYGPGPVMLRELAAFGREYPRDRPKALRREARVGAGAPCPEPAEMAAGPLAEAAAGEPSDQDQIEPSSSHTESADDSAVRLRAKEQEVEVSKEDMELARRALAERMQRRHPRRSPPRWFDAGEISMVAVCTAALEGDAESKMLALRDAIAGAFLGSRDGPPTVRFIWGKLEHFLDHVDRGRRQRVAYERAALRGQLGPSRRAEGAHGSTVPHHQMHADLERVFGPGWLTTTRANRGA